MASFDQQLSAAWESSRSSGSAVHGIGYSVDVDVRALGGGGCFYGPTQNILDFFII